MSGTLIFLLGAISLFSAGCAQTELTFEERSLDCSARRQCRAILRFTEEEDGTISVSAGMLVRPIESLETIEIDSATLNNLRNNNEATRRGFANELVAQAAPFVANSTCSLDVSSIAAAIGAAGEAIGGNSSCQPTQANPCSSGSIVMQCTKNRNPTETPVASTLSRTGNSVPNEALGIQIYTDNEAAHLSTRKNEMNIIQEFELSDAIEMKTPLPTGLKLPPLKEVSESVLIEKFRSLLGKLLYIARCVRYDICYSVNFLSRYLSNHSTTI